MEKSKKSSIATWIEEHPFKMASIIGCLAFAYGISFHYFRHIPNDWNGFILWSPIVFAIPYGLASLFYFSERRALNNGY